MNLHRQSGKALLICLCMASAAFARSKGMTPVSAHESNPEAAVASATARVLSLPRLERAPTLEDFSDMTPNAFGSRLSHAQSFIQSDPKDGDAATQKTEAYLGYDDK